METKTIKSHSRDNVALDLVDWQKASSFFQMWVWQIFQTHEPNYIAHSKCLHNKTLWSKILNIWVFFSCYVETCMHGNALLHIRTAMHSHLGVVEGHPAVAFSSIPPFSYHSGVSNWWPTRHQPSSFMLPPLPFFSYFYTSGSFWLHVCFQDPVISPPITHKGPRQVCHSYSLK